MLHLLCQNCVQCFATCTGGSQDLLQEYKLGTPKSRMHKNNGTATGKLKIKRILARRICFPITTNNWWLKYLIALGKRKLSISSPFLAISANLSYDPIQFSYTKIDQAYISGFYFFIPMPPISVTGLTTNILGVPYL